MAFSESYLAFRSLGRVVVFALAFCRPISASAQKANGESFTIRMPNYFVELQGGQRVDLEIHYRYAPNIARADIPDYRAVQILVEDALYGMPDTSPYWEITNPEIVLRLLKTFPQFPTVESQFFIQPRAILNISRGSTVEFSQADAQGRTLLTQLDQDRYYQARPNCYNILVPRPLKASVAELSARLRASTENTKSARPAILDVACFPLAGSEYTMPTLLASVKPKGSYDAIVLPESVGAKYFTKVAEVGPLIGIVKVINEGLMGNPVVETSLGDLLGLDAATATKDNLANTRESFYVGKASSIIVEEKYAWPYRLRKYTIEPYGTNEKVAVFSVSPSDEVPTILLRK